MTQPIPQGYNNVTPCLIVKDCAKAIETYKQAFNATENSQDRTQCPDSDKIMHTVIQIGNSKIMMQDEFPGCPATQGASFYVYVPDADKSMEQAKKAGLEIIMPAEDMFWGDRLGAIKDPCGIQWSIATHKRDVSREELEKGARAMAKNMNKAA